MKAELPRVTPKKRPMRKKKTALILSSGKMEN